jgi:holo-[acyl-carrier protein] synthase
MIFGIGCDIAEVGRIKKQVDSFGNKFLTRILSLSEIDEYNSIILDNKKILYLAKRFAAKEAFSKAVGTGIGKEVSFTDISVLNDALGKPYIKVTDNLDQYLCKLLSCDTHYRTHVSLSDEKDFALAFITIETG